MIRMPQHRGRRTPKVESRTAEVEETLAQPATRGLQLSTGIQQALSGLEDDEDNMERASSEAHSIIRRMSRASEAENVAEEARCKALGSVVREIVETERRFLDRLRVAVDCFKRPLERWAVETAPAERGSSGQSSPVKAGSSVLRMPSSADDGDGTPRSPVSPSRTSSRGVFFISPDDDCHCTPSEIEVFFGNIDACRQWSEDLCLALEKAVELETDDSESDSDERIWTTATRVARILTRATPGLRAHFGRYIRGFDQARAALAKASPGTKIFVRALELHPLSRGLPLESYLAEPVQRVPRYALLLHEALKRAPTVVDEPSSSSSSSSKKKKKKAVAAEECRSAVAEAEASVKAACEEINASVADKELLEVMASAWNMPQLLLPVAAAWNAPELAESPQRALLHTGTLTKVSKTWGKRKVAALAFTDLFCYGTDSRLRRRSFNQQRVQPLSKNAGQLSPTKADVVKNKRGAPKFDTFTLQKAVPLVHAVLFDRTTVYCGGHAASLDHTDTQQRLLAETLPDLEALGVDLAKLKDFDARTFLIAAPATEHAEAVPAIVLRADTLADKAQWIAALTAGSASEPPPAFVSAALFHHI